MKESIHGHQVMELMMGSGRGYSRRELTAELDRLYGADADYHTCALQDLSAEALIDFLLQKGKLVEKADGLHVSISRTCFTTAAIG